MTIRPENEKRKKDKWVAGNARRSRTEGSLILIVPILDNDPLKWMSPATRETMNMYTLEGIHGVILKQASGHPGMAVFPFPLSCPRERASLYYDRERLANSKTRQSR